MFSGVSLNRKDLDDFLPQAAVGSSVVFGIAAVIIGILAITHQLPRVGAHAGAVITGVGGFCFVFTVILVCANYYKKKKEPFIDNFSTLTSSNADVKVKTLSVDNYQLQNKKLKDRKLETSLSLSYYFCGLAYFETGTKKLSLLPSSYDLCMDLIFHQRKEAALLTKKEIQCPNESIDFAYTPLIELNKENFDPKILRKILNRYIDENKNRTIPKLFVSMAVEPTVGIPHALLLVIEANPKEHTQARITLIDSFGATSGYQIFKEKILRIAQESFPSPKSRVFINSVKQQIDGWSCGWHMFANIMLLAKEDNVQKFVMKKMPTRPDIENFASKFYQEHILAAALKWNAAVPKEDRKLLIDYLFATGKLKGDPQGIHKEWYEDTIENGIELQSELN